MKTDEELWQEVLDVFEDNREAVKPSPQDIEALLQPVGRPVPLWRRIAAVALAVFLVGGLVWATVRLTIPRPSPRSACCDSIATIQSDGKAAPADSVRLFVDTRLDSLLTIVARHYGRTLCLQSEDLAGMRLLTKWYVRRPLSAFVESMNEFEGLRLTDERDTLFVSSKEEEDQP
ncbi:MAG: hypothetical protein IJT19_10070 [Bacteroidaceae bacterium]|nr:hypothetical protein [Bacteroidaceae bacterium]